MHEVLAEGEVNVDRGLAIVLTVTIGVVLSAVQACGAWAAPAAHEEISEASEASLDTAERPRPVLP